MDAEGFKKMTQKVTFLSRAYHNFLWVGVLFVGITRAVSFYDGSLSLTLRRIVRVLIREGFSGFIRRANILMMGVGRSNHRQLPSSVELYGEVPSISTSFNPKVSVIVPNFNHERYLPERLESIYKQSYANIEVILLDDCSSDQSVGVLSDYAERFSEKTITCFNEHNSGGVFNQWKKGLELATGDLIWIAESDDYCTLNLLEELVSYFQNSAVMLAFSRTEFVQGTPALKTWSSEEYLSDLGLGIWDQSFIKSAHTLVKEGWVVKNLVPNVSAAVFKHPGQLALLQDPQWLNLRLCGDWVFYLTIIRGGLVGYSPKACNYYRQHALNTSVNAQKEALYYQEHEVVASYLATLFNVDKKDFDRQENHLYSHWCRRQGSS